MQKIRLNVPRNKLEIETIPGMGSAKYVNRFYHIDLFEQIILVSI